MFELLFIRICEWTITGKPIQAFLAKATSISRKTWDAGGPKRAAARARANAEAKEFGRQFLRRQGVSEAGIARVEARLPETTDTEPYWLSSLVRQYTVVLEAVPETLELARQMDEFAHELWQAKCSGDFAECKRRLLESPFLERNYFADTERELINTDLPRARRQVQEAGDFEELQQALGFITFNQLLSLLACWDLEFCRSYFPSLRAFPLFETLMFKLPHDFLENPKFGRNVFSYPLRKLIDLLAIFGDAIRHNFSQKPRKVKVKTMVTWLEMGDPQIPSQKLWNWRSGRDAFLMNDLELVWRRFTGGYDGNSPLEHIPPPPIPLFLAACIWQHLLLKFDQNNRLRRFSCIQPWYLWWWEYHRTRLAAKGVTWGDRPWPKCISDQSSWSDG